MSDLKTTYLGLELKNPFVASASALSKKLDNIKKMEEAGLSAWFYSPCLRKKLTMKAWN